jgi:hypothetical protein
MTNDTAALAAEVARTAAVLEEAEAKCSVCREACDAASERIRTVQAEASELETRIAGSDPDDDAGLGELAARLSVVRGKLAALATQHAARLTEAKEADGVRAEAATAHETAKREEILSRARALDARLRALLVSTAEEMGNGIDDLFQLREAASRVDPSARATGNVGMYGLGILDEDVPIRWRDAYVLTRDVREQERVRAWRQQQRTQQDAASRARAARYLAEGRADEILPHEDAWRFLPPGVRQPRPVQEPEPARMFEIIEQPKPTPEYDPMAVLDRSDPA